MNKGETEDDVLSYANLRLMERLAALAPTPDTYTQITSFKLHQTSFTSTAADSVASLYRDKMALEGTGKVEPPIR